MKWKGTRFASYKQCVWSGHPLTNHGLERLSWLQDPGISPTQPLPDQTLCLLKMSIQASEVAAFFQYYGRKDLAETPKGVEVSHLAQHFASLDTDGKKALARDWLSKCGTKGSVRAFLSQTVTQECQLTGGKISGYVGAAEVARLTGLSAVGLAPKELQSTLEAEIKQSQDKHGIPGQKAAAGQ